MYAEIGVLSSDVTLQRILVLSAMSIGFCVSSMSVWSMYDHPQISKLRYWRVAFMLSNVSFAYIFMMWFPKSQFVSVGIVWFVHWPCGIIVWLERDGAVELYSADAELMVSFHFAYRSSEFPLLSCVAFRLYMLFSRKGGPLSSSRMMYVSCSSLVNSGVFIVNLTGYEPWLPSVMLNT